MSNEVQVDTLGGGSGIAAQLLKHGFNPNALRPFAMNADGQAYIANAQSNGVIPVQNATLLYDEWKFIDRAVRQTAKQRLRWVNTLRAMGLTMALPNAMSKTVMTYQNQSDISAAQVSMDGLGKGNNDRPDYDLTTIPIPIVHKDFFFSARELATSREGGHPLDTSNAELATRMVSETIEEMHLGTYGTYAYGGGTLYGLVNFPSRNTRTITAWDASSKTGLLRLTDVLNMKQDLLTARHYGPYKLLISANYETILDDEYSTAYPQTLRQRIMQIESIDSIEVSDWLSDDTLVLVQMTSDVVQLINGFDPVVVQWETEGGMRLNFKVMAILPPRIRADYNSRCGIVHATV